MGRRERLPRIRSGMGQTLLSKPELVDQIKRDMLVGEFRFESPEARIFGWKDARGTHYISEGHHRVVAALELDWESGDRSHLDRLLACGIWQPSPPPKNRRLPTRSLWSRLLYRIGF
ncbi:MAG TPA: hypothetical protein VML55_00875 [Planctomycetaceae bacterium]|nr:hypothetical protein [Planctomycetaceae bacterium]